MLLNILIFGLFGLFGHAVLEPPVYLLEVHPIVQCHGLELGERTVHLVAQCSIGHKADLVAPLNDDGLAGVHVHTLARGHARHLERAQPFHFHLLVIVQPLVDDLEHAGHELLGGRLVQSVLGHQYAGYFLVSYLAHVSCFA